MPYLGRPLALVRQTGRTRVHRRGELLLVPADAWLQRPQPLNDQRRPRGIGKLANRLAAGLDRPAQTSSVVSVPVEDAEGARASLAAQGIRAAVRAGGVRLAPHVYNSAEQIDVATRALAPFVAASAAALA